MVRYMLSLPRIRDVKMDDGTTAFSMALGRKDLEMIGVFLEIRHQSDIDPIELAKRTLLEMDRDGDGDSSVRLKLEQTLKQQKISIKKGGLPKAQISQE